MEFNSIAMIETNGLVSSITALEKMLKLGDIKFLKREIISNGQVTVFISGDSANLQRALEAGEIAAKNVGIVISSSLIENPTTEILDLILECKKDSVKTKRSKKRNPEVEEEKIDTLFDNVVEDAILEESTKETSKDVIVEETISEVPKEELEEDKMVNNSDDFIGLIADEELENDSEAENYLDPEDDTTKEFSPSDEIIVEEENKNTLPLEIIVDVTSTPNNDIKDDESNQGVELEDENVSKKDQFANLSHLDRLKAEAKLEIENELSVNNSLIEKDEETNVLNSVPAATEKIVTEETSMSNSIPNIDDTEYSNMNVPQLRKLARNNAKFPIKGRDISKANRKVLLEYFKQIL